MEFPRFDFVRLIIKNTYNNFKFINVTTTVCGNAFYGLPLMGATKEAKDLVVKIENIDFGESVEVLADRANIKLPENDTNIDYERIKLKERYLINQ